MFYNFIRLINAERLGYVVSIIYKEWWWWWSCK